MIINLTKGAGREGLTKKNLEKFLIAIPSISEQIEIKKGEIFFRKY
jgi:restriction endonuclease S subunit